MTSRKLMSVCKVLRLLPPEMPGKTRLARLLLGSSLEAQDVQLQARHGCAFVVPSLRESIGFHLLVDGVYEVETLRCLLEHLTTGSVFIDVGANIGVFALPAARKVGLPGRVIAVEASPRMFSYLRWNVRLNGLDNIRLIQCAAFNQDLQMVQFYEAPAAHFGMGAVAPQFDADPVAVLGQTLDQIVADEKVTRVDLLKVDVEGCEAAVFQGAVGLLTGDDPPMIVFEFCDWAEERTSSVRVGDAQRILRDYGFEIWRLPDFLRGEPSLTRVLTVGFEMLVARKRK